MSVEAADHLGTRTNRDGKRAKKTRRGTGSGRIIGSEVVEFAQGRSTIFLPSPGAAGVEGLPCTREEDEIQPRRAVVESAYWNPSVVTGKDGKAIDHLQGAPALAEYRITARGVTGADTLVGQTTARAGRAPEGLLRRPEESPATADARTPTRPRFIAQVHHTGVRGTGRSCAVASSMPAAATTVFPKTLEHQGRRRSLRSSFDPCSGSPRGRLPPFDPHRRPSARSKRTSWSARSRSVPGASWSSRRPRGQSSDRYDRLRQPPGRARRTRTPRC